MTGASMIMLEHVRHLASAGAEVDVFGEKVDGHLIRQAGGSATRVWRLPVGKYLSRRAFSIRFDRFVRRRAHDLVIGNGDVLNQDVVFVHNLLRKEAETVYGGQLRELKPLIKMHDLVLSRQGFKLCVANSRLMQRDLSERYGVPADRIKVVYPGYDAERFSIDRRLANRQSARTALGIRDAILIGFVTSGRLRKRGFDFLLSTLSMLSPSTLEKTKVLVVGSAKEIRRFVDARFAHLFERHMLSVEPTPDVERFYHALDIFFHPARIEEFGLVVQEAAACGLPVLTSRQVGAAELLADTDGCSVVDQPAPGLFAERLDELIEDGALRERRAAEAHRAFAGNTWDRYFREVMRHYKAHGLLPS